MKTMYAWIVLTILFFLPVFVVSQVKQGDVVEKDRGAGSSFIPFSSDDFPGPGQPVTDNPAIADMVAAINEDSLTSTLVALQGWGSRFLMKDNNREIANALVDKFISYGYTDVKLDSFYLALNWGAYSDSAWQYNVVCTLRGASAQDELYIVGGHWDSYCQPDPFTFAPGVDDNGTAVAATLEIARVMKLYNYQPEATIRFTLYAAEELGLFGSRYDAAHARMSGTDVRYMLNMDMVSNNPDNLQQVKIYQYYGMEWAGKVAAAATEQYTELSVVVPQNLIATGSDSFPFWLEGFPSAYFEEIVFSPNWHLPSDILGNCNIPYLKKVTGGALATLAGQQLLPYPQNLEAHSANDRITLNWLPTRNSFVAGVNVYRSDISGSGYQKINSSPVTDSLYHDVPQWLNKPYYYVITTVNDSLQESAFSNEVTGARFNFCDTLLVIANTRGSMATPDSVRTFYDAILDTIPYRWLDLNADNRIDITQFSRYRNIFWMSNNTDFEPFDNGIYFGMMAFLENRGNLLFTGFYPAKQWISPGITYPLAIPEGVFYRELFKVDSIDRKVTGMLNAAKSSAPGYDTLHIDPRKQLDKNFPGQIYNIEIEEPADEANVIYRFGTKYDSTTSYGKMKNRPVGLEYMGIDHQSILLSFPLWYVDTADARKFLKYVVTQKFGYKTGMASVPAGDNFSLKVYPNPARDGFQISFTNREPGQVRIQLVSVMGQPVATLVDVSLSQGTHLYHFDTGALSPGVYQVVLKHGKRQEINKLVIIH
jgi:hypothetical protein